MPRVKKVDLWHLAKHHWTIHWKSVLHQWRTLLHITKQLADELTDHGSIIFHTQQNLSRAVYEICHFFSKVSESDFDDSNHTNAYTCTWYNTKTRKWKEMREVEHTSIGDIMTIPAFGNTLPPNKLLIIQKWDASHTECPQAYPTLSLLDTVSDYRTTHKRWFVFMNNVMWSSIFWTPHAQVQPNYWWKIITREQDVTEDQQFTPAETVDIIRTMNKQGKLSTILALQNGKFAIMEVDNFLGIQPRPDIILDETQWYQLQFHNTPEQEDTMLFAKMAWDLSGNQWLAIGGVEVRTKNIVFEKETIYYRFYKWMKRWVTQTQLHDFLITLLPESDNIDTIIEKISIYTNHMKQLDVTPEDLITRYCDDLWTLLTHNRSELETLENNNNILQKKILLAFLLTKWKIQIEDGQIIDTHQEHDIRLLRDTQLLSLYNKCAWTLLTKTV